MLKVDAHTYALSQQQDIAGIKEAARQAARSGGDFIEVVACDSRKVSVLVMPGVSVVLEQQEIPEDEASETAPSLHFDFDFDFDF